MQNDNQQSTRSKDDLTSKAREVGRDLKDQASEFAQSATQTVKSQAASMTRQAREAASEASDKMMDVAADAGEKMKAAVADQKNAGADYVGNLADVVRRASYAFDSDLPQAGHYIRQASAQITSVSDALRTRDISELAGEVQAFARKQPAAFFGAAVLAGFAAVRFFKSAPERNGYGSGMSRSGTGGQMASSAGGSSYRGGSYPGGSYTGGSTTPTSGLQR